MIWERREVEKTETCWLWTGAKNHKGYGVVNRLSNGGKQYVHRISFEQASGVDPAGFLVCHLCDVRNCLRPEHLVLGDDFSNMQDMVIKGRSHGQKKTHCRNGHPLSGENLIICKRGWRECRICRRAKTLRWRERHGL